MPENPPASIKRLMIAAYRLRNRGVEPSRDLWCWSEAPGNLRFAIYLPDSFDVGIDHAGERDWATFREAEYWVRLPGLE